MLESCMWIFLLGLLRLVSCNCSPKREEFSAAVADQVLVGPKTGSVFSPSEGVCQFQCIQDRYCSLFNYGPNGECEVLNGRSQQFVFQSKPGWIAKAQKCKSNVCENGGTCLSIGEVKNTTCVCQTGFKGNKCQATDCPSGWHYYQNKCYKLFSDIVVMSVAEQNCIAEGGHLASIKNIEENEFIYKTVLEQKSGIWIGLNDIAQEGVFKWTDGESPVFQNFIDGHPNNLNGNQHCVLITGMPGSNGRWDDVYCTLERKYVCKK